MTTEPLSFTEQDYALIIEALAQWAGRPNERETRHDRRAWDLIEYIGVHTDCRPSELLGSLDEDTEYPRLNYSR